MAQYNLQGAFDKDYLGFSPERRAQFYGKGGPGDPDANNTGWWDDIGDMLGGDGFLGGVKGWLDLGVKGMEAYTGYQQVGIAKEQNQMARQNLAFQQNSWGKDYTARRIAYNQNAMGRQDWKDANDPNRERYSMETLVPA
jgi:hypothetical protein